MSVLWAACTLCLDAEEWESHMPNNASSSSHCSLPNNAPSSSYCSLVFRQTLPARRPGTSSRHATAYTQKDTIQSSKTNWIGYFSGGRAASFDLRAIHMLHIMERGQEMVFDPVPLTEPSVGSTHSAQMIGRSLVRNYWTKKK